jgi:hypothetical protein
MKRLIAAGTALALLLFAFAACARPMQALGAAELLGLGEKYLLDMNYAQAAVYFERLIEVEPRNPRGYTGLSEAYLGLGDADGAVSALRDGFAKLRDDGEFLGELAERYEDIIEGAPNTQDAYIGLADALLALGSEDGAADALRRGLERLPDSRRIAAMLAELDAASEAESPGDSAQPESYDVADGAELGDPDQRTTERQDAEQQGADRQGADRQDAVRQGAEAQSEPSPAPLPSTAPPPALSPSPAPLPTPSPPPAPSPASSPTPRPVDVFPTMSKAQHKALHTFFSNFSEAGMDDFDISGYSASEIVGFALWHEYINNGKKYSYSDGYMAVPASAVEKDAARYFGIGSVDHDAYADDWHYYDNGNYYLSPASGEPMKWSQVTELLDNGDGTYTASIDVYWSHNAPDNLYEDIGDWHLPAGYRVFRKGEQTDSLEDLFGAAQYIYSCVGVAKPFTYNGNPTYQLIALATAEPAPESAQAPGEAAIADGKQIAVERALLDRLFSTYGDMQSSLGITEDGQFEGYSKYYVSDPAAPVGYYFRATADWEMLSEDRCFIVSGQLKSIVQGLDRPMPLDEFAQKLHSVAHKATYEIKTGDETSHYYVSGKYAEVYFAQSGEGDAIVACLRIDVTGGGQILPEAYTWLSISDDWPSGW